MQLSDSTDKSKSNMLLDRALKEIHMLLTGIFQKRITASDSESVSSENSDQEDNQSTLSFEFSRSMTAKRKDYVRRISVANTNKISIGTIVKVHRAFKSKGKHDIDASEDYEAIQTSASALCDENRRSILLDSVFNTSQDDEAPAAIDANIYENLSFQGNHADKLFQVCLVIGWDPSQSNCFVKFHYPRDAFVPDNFELLVFPDDQLIAPAGRDNQEHSLIFTYENGTKVYGYCRRVRPENSEMCLPLAYCILSGTNDVGFYHKLLKEIEYRHGQGEEQLEDVLQIIWNTQKPTAGQTFQIKIPKQSEKIVCDESNKISMENKEKSLDTSENNKLITSSLDNQFDEILIRRPNDLRLEKDELSELLQCLGPDILIDIFGSLLHERKVIMQGQNMSMVSKAILALESILYPFQWQYTVVTALPQHLNDFCGAPVPVLVGVLDEIPFDIEDGIVVDMDRKEIVQCCGDEHIIIPTSLRKSLKLTLNMVNEINQATNVSNVLISEAFLRYFVELFPGINTKNFHKDNLIQKHRRKDVKYFLEWFMETSMFRQFYHNRNAFESDVTDFYNLFNARVIENGVNKSESTENIEAMMKNSKIIRKNGTSVWFR